ncbi:MAG: TerD family protein [Myxococcales bacterium]|nr:TerD family protein [Myxococcales bacterium]
MGLSLSKGGNLSLSKEAPGFTKLKVGLGWDIRTTDGAAFDLDACAFMLGADGKVRSNGDFAFYGQQATQEGAIKLGGDNRTGAGDGDDETMELDITKVPADIHRVAVCISIYEADQRRQNFGMVRSAFARVVDLANNREIGRFDLSEDASLDTALIFAEIYRHNGEWKFKAIGQGYAGGLGPLARNFGVDI